MKRIILFIFVVYVVSRAVPAYGQDKFHVHFDYNYLVGFYEKSDFWTIKSGLHGFDLNLTAMYDISKRLSAGVGIAVEKLYDPSYTLFPVFAHVNYSPLRKTQKPYVYGKLGYSIGTGISNPGLLFATGIGYKIKLREHFGFNFMLGYHLQNIRYDITYYSEEWDIIGEETGHNNRHSLSLGVGFIF